MKSRPLLYVVLVGGLAALSMPEPARAQPHRLGVDGWSVEAFAGAASPKGDLGDVNDDGVLAGVAFSRWLQPQLAVRLEGVFENLERGGRPAFLGGTRGPKTDLWHYIVGVEALFTHPGRTDWRVGMNLGIGGTYLDVGSAPTVDGVAANPEVTGFSGHEFTGRAGLLAGYEVASAVTFFVRGGGFLMFGDAHDPTGSFLGKEAVLTHEIGVRVSF